MYKALINIGEYKKGQEVPTEKAEVWMSMYKVSPVELVSGESKPEVESKEEGSSILDDYLARGKSVVVKNIKEDKLSSGQLLSLLSLEQSGKKRKDVIKAIQERLE